MRGRKDDGLKKGRAFNLSPREGRNEKKTSIFFPFE